MTALTPNTEALDGPALLSLAVLLTPPEQLVAQLDDVLAATRREVLALVGVGWLRLELSRGRR